VAQPLARVAEPDAALADEVASGPAPCRAPAARAIADPLAATSTRPGCRRVDAVADRVSTSGWSRKRGTRASRSVASTSVRVASRSRSGRLLELQVSGSRRRAPAQRHSCLARPGAPSARGRPAAPPRPPPPSGRSSDERATVWSVVEEEVRAGAGPRGRRGASRRAGARARRRAAAAREEPVVLERVASASIGEGSCRWRARRSA